MDRFKYILKVKSTRFADGPNVASKGQAGVKVIDLPYTWPFTVMRETEGAMGFMCVCRGG